MPDFPQNKKIKQIQDAPQQAAPYVLNLPQPPVRNAEEYLKAYIGYVYTAVGAIAQEVASIDLHLYKVRFVNGKPKTSEIYQHPALSILNYVNELSTLYDLLEATQTYLELTGECFWVTLKDTAGVPQEIWLLRPDWVKIIPSQTEIIDHYNYYAGGVITDKVEIPKQNMVPFKYLHPMNPYRGKGAVQAAALPFDILNFAQEYNRNFFFNSAIPSIVFTSEQKLSEQTTKRFLQQWQSSFGGRAKSNKVAFLGNGIKMDKASFAAKELDFNDQIKQMRDDVLAVFKVPKTVLGLTEDVNRANADATTRAFMERVITPRMKKLVGMLNEFYLPMFIGQDNSLFFDFTDPSPEDTELKLKRYASGLGTGGAKPWLTQNEVRMEENLPPLEGGDSIEVSQPGSGGIATPISPEEDPLEPSDETPGNQEPDKPVTPVGEVEDRLPSWRKALIKSLGGRIENKKEYSPPTYLIAPRPIKHMMPVPVKRLEDLQKEKMAQDFVKPLTEFIGRLVATDEYSPLSKKKKVLNKKDLELNQILKEVLDPTKKETVKEEEAASQSVSQGSGWTQEQKSAYWYDFIKKADVNEVKVKEICQKVFKEQEAKVIASLEDKMKSWRKRLGKAITPAGVVPSLDDLNKMWDVLLSAFEEIYKTQGNDTLDLLGVGGEINLTSEFASQYLHDYGGTLISQIDNTTRDKLMGSLSQGFDQGEGIDKLKVRVQDVFTEADSNRAELIARTETLKASNAATVEAYRQSGVVSGKEWLTEMDNRTCPLCEDQDGKVVSLDDNYFDQGDSVDVGGQTFSFDYTDVGEPPAHGDCRCTTIPVLLS